MRAQSLEEQCKNISTQFLQLRSKRYLLCLGSPVFALFPEASLNFNQTNQTSNIFIPLDFISECLFVWHFSHQGWGREGFKKPFFNQPFLFGPPSLSLFLGGHQLSTLVSTTHISEIRTKDRFTQLSFKVCSWNHLVRPPQTFRAQEKREKQLSHCVGIFINRFPHAFFHF